MLGSRAAQCGGMESSTAECFAFKSIHEGSLSPGEHCLLHTLAAQAQQKLLHVMATWLRDRNTNPRPTQMPNATHSAGEKCPGKMGKTFMRQRSKETAIPREVTTRIHTRFSTIQNDRHAANQPRADAIEPTSVTGTSSASPRKRPASVPAVIPRTATEGVINFSCTVPKSGSIVRLRPYANSKRLEATKLPLKH